MKQALDANGYPTAPRKIGELGWYYEELCGLVVYVAHVAPHDGVKISWARLEKALSNHHRVMTRKKRKGRLTR